MRHPRHRPQRGFLGYRNAAMGFLDGTETPDVPRYEAMLREAADELTGIVEGSRQATMVLI